MEIFANTPAPAPTTEPERFNETWNADGVTYDSYEELLADAPAGSVVYHSWRDKDGFDDETYRLPEFG